MGKLEDTFQKISKFPNGEKVAKRMTQLWELFLETEEPSPERVVEVIEANEENLLERPWADIVRNKRVLPKFTKALRESTDKEWEDFKKEHEINPLGKADRERVVLDSSGLVRNTGFKEWVLGEKANPVNKEGQTLLTEIIRRDSKGKE